MQGPVEVERIAGRDDHPDHLAGGAGGLELGEQAREPGLRRRGADDDQQLVADHADEPEDVEAAEAGDEAQDGDHEDRARAPERDHEQAEAGQRRGAELRDGERHAARGAGGAAHMMIRIIPKITRLADSKPSTMRNPQVVGEERDRRGRDDGEHEDLEDLVLPERGEEAVGQQRVGDEGDEPLLPARLADRLLRAGPPLGRLGR